MLEHIQVTAEKACGLLPGRRVLVGVSGGPDSLCLLYALWQAGYPLAVAHLDHGLRPEASEEAAGVQAAAKAVGALFTHARVDAAAFAAHEGLSLEEAARMLRYRFLFAQAEATSAQAVAVGHTADDQVETVLMHLLRGAGLPGLKGMDYRSLPNPWSSRLPLVRPLLGVWRAEVLAFVTTLGLHPSQDPTNQDLRFFRNRLRHELIPYLQGYNPQIKSLVWRSAEVLRDEDAVLEAMAQDAWEASILASRARDLAGAAPAVAIRPQALLAFPRGIQRRVVRRAFAALRPGLRDIDFHAVERTLAFLERPTATGLRDLAAGLRLVQEGELVWLAAWEAGLPDPGWPQVPSGKSLGLDAPGVLSLPGDWRLSARFVTRRPELERDPGAEDAYQAWLDASRLRLPLQVRGRLPGDRFQPLGMGGRHIKLSDFMINTRLPRRARALWPLVFSGDTLAWVPGFRIGEPFRVTPETASILHLQLSLHG